jgi:hypothetical protein
VHLPYCAVNATTRFALVAVLLAVAWAGDVRAAAKTVCTITVNSPDERETFRRALPRGDFEFVELVERGRPDWLASACRQQIHCDVLIISGHFDDGSEFYSDRLDAREHLPVDEMERVACSDTCPGLFSQLKEVYLFGCNTLNADARQSASAEIGRSLARSGRTPAEAERVVRELNERYAQSNRDRMRSIFKDVPVIYGFSGKAPLGPAAAAVLGRYFESGAASDIGSGHVSARLLNLFAPVSMKVAGGMRDQEPLAVYRQDACHFSDDRLSTAQKLAFVREILQRDMAEVRMFLDAIDSYVGSLSAQERQTPSVAAALDEIAGDQAARARYLEFARDADEPAVRARMIDVAHNLGWLSSTEQRAEFIRMIGERIAANAAGSSEVDLVCARNANGELDDARRRLQLAAAQADKTANAAVLACLGSAEARARTLRALTSRSDDDVEIAQVYLRHRPIADVAELRTVTMGIARMDASPAQVRALDTLAGLRLSDRPSLDALTRLFPQAKTVNVQRAIAGILIRADYHALAVPEIARTLRQYRLKSPDGEDLIDVLIRRLQAS